MSELVVAGVPAIMLAFGLTEFVKRFGVTGNALTAVSAVIGVLVSIAFSLSVAVPTNYAGWLGVVVTGIVYGLTASGVYDFLNKKL
jgi:hypothetical protein